MNFKRIFGIIIALVGIASLGASYYITTQVEAGKQEIESAQKKVDTGSGLFSLNPITKEIGKGLTDSAQEKINAGKEQVREYEMLAGKLQVGGIALIIVGTGIAIICRKKKKN